MSHPTASATVPARYAVIGNPIAHSKSPLIHTRFAQQTGESIAYEHLLAPLEGFQTSVADFIAAGGQGLNVTVPFKLEAHRLAHRLSPRAAAAGAVNTLKFGADGIWGDNTDGIGLVRDIQQNMGITLIGRRVLLLGAGGAARGTILPLLECRPAELCVVNRTAVRALELADAFADASAQYGCRFTAGTSEVAAGRFDLVINATAGSLDGQLPVFDPSALGPGTLAYDMMYGPKPTIFIAHAQQLGARAADGLGMLVEQAAESFWIWRGVRPQTAPVLAELRATLQG